MASDPGATHGAALATLEHHFQAMPPVAALRIRVDGFDGDCLRLSAPLARAQILPATARATPALSDGFLYARNEDTGGNDVLVCLDLR